MKKVISILLTIALTAALTACVDDVGEVISDTMKYNLDTKISNANSDAKTIHNVVAMSIAELDSRGEPLPTGNLAISCSGSLWEIKGTPANAVSLIKDNLTKDFAVVGNGVVYIGDNGSIVAVVWDPDKTGANMAVWGNGGWSSAPERTTSNIYGTYPEIA